MILTVLAAATAAVSSSARPRAARPHIALIVADDYGWANIGYHAAGNEEVQTPVLDALAGDGVKLERHYAYKFCAPTRSAIQSGRLPVHVNTVNADAAVHNSRDPVGGYAGIPVNMTTLGDKMKAAGYKAYATGKWDVGMATPRHTPLGRGYDKFLGYFHHANDYYTEKIPVIASGADVCGNKYRDLWEDTAPAGYNDTSIYEEEIFINHTLRVIADHDPAKPMFLYHAFHLVHVPLEVPKPWLDKFAFVKNSELQRLPYSAMTNYMDTDIGRILDAFRTKGMYDDLLVVFMSDNGGPIYFPCGANNHPLKGGKESDWEGGVRVNAFVGGGYLPDAVRGTEYHGFIHAADWYATFAHLAGVDAADPEAAAAGLPDVDSINVWGDITGVSNNSRTTVHLSECAYIEGRYKIVGCKQGQAGWTDAIFPETGKPQPLFLGGIPVPLGGDWPEDCTAGCLFDIIADPEERTDLAATQPALRDRMLATLASLNAGNYNPDRGSGSPDACTFAERRYNGHYGPFVGVPDA